MVLIARFRRLPGEFVIDKRSHLDHSDPHIGGSLSRRSLFERVMDGPKHLESSVIASYPGQGHEVTRSELA